MFSAFFQSRFAAAALAAVFLLGGTAAAAEGDACDFQGTDDGREVKNGVCVSPMAADAVDKCVAAGWDDRAFSFTVPIGDNTEGVSVACQIPIRRFGVGAPLDESACTIYANLPGSVNCAEIFGAGIDFPENDGSGDQRFIYNCPNLSEPDPDYVSGEAQSCVALNEKGVCAGLFGGEAKTAGVEEICTGIDANDTFCIVGAPEAFPCKGLFRHVARCNFDYNRRALNPFFCGALCGERRVAKGANCPCGAGFVEESEGGACVPESE